MKPVSRISIVFDGGGTGDAIARLPVIPWILENHKHIAIDFWVPDYFLPIATNVLPSTARLGIYPFSQYATRYDRRIPERRFETNKYTTLSSHLTEHAFAILANTQVPNTEKNYLQLNLANVDITSFDLPERYVVLTTGYTAPAREFNPETVNTISQYLLTNGLTPVFLGSDKVETGVPRLIKANFNGEIDYSNGVNLINKTSLLEAAKIIDGSKAIIGVDNGLLHLAAMTNTPIVAGFTNVDPIYRLPYRNNLLGYKCFTVIPDESVNCRFLQSREVFLMHEFTKCICTNNDCIKSLTSDKFINALNSALH